jgi:DNA-binding transcriptional LysR family regulator
MSLSSLYLDAFAEVARQKSFSAAAKKLNVTQSALSQRVLNLEEEIGFTLFVRDPAGVRLTELGQKLLRYCQSKELLETEFLSGLRTQDQKTLGGVIRIAGFSSVTRSVILPALAELVRSHPLLELDLRTNELRELPQLLATGATDFIVLNQPLEKQGLTSHLLGYELNVLIQGTGKNAAEDVYLDHDEEDSMTHDFFRHQGRKNPPLKRRYLDEIYAIVDGVRLGLGRAVIPKHLIEGAKGIEIVSGLKPLRTPVYLCYYTQAYYSRLQTAVIEKLVSDLPTRLSE